VWSPPMIVKPKPRTLFTRVVVIISPFNSAGFLVNTLLSVNWNENKVKSTGT
jgi:hypothetical protein